MVKLPLLMTRGTSILERLQQRFRSLYGAEGDRCMDRFAMMIGRYGVNARINALQSEWSQQDAVLITYGDMVHRPGEKPLATLHRFLNTHLDSAINTIHLLPFFPYSSDDGFSILDYRSVNPDLGCWQEIDAMAEDYRLMADMVLNHCSRQSDWFQAFIGGVAPCRDYFITETDELDTSQVVRPRTSPLLSPVMTRRGPRRVWTTFSEDQVDLDFSNPDVLFEFLDILLFYMAHGIRVIRLDAIAYLWKRSGTSCIHLPETHEIVKLFRDMVDMLAPQVLLLTETNVPHEENVSYFGNSDEAHMVYQFSLAPLLLHGLQNGTSRYLTRWAGGLGDPPSGCTFFNFTASHDGIGVRPVEGLLPKPELGQLIEGVLHRGGRVSYKANPDGSESPYELNITYFDGLCDPDQPDSELDIARFLCSQAVMLALRGIPAIYFHSLLGGRNYEDGVTLTGKYRTINRYKWEEQELLQRLNDSRTTESRILKSMLHLLKCRQKQSAFHPDGPQDVLDAGDELFLVKRYAPDRSEALLAVHNMTPSVVALDTRTLRSTVELAPPLVDLITADKLQQDAEGVIDLNPYQVMWIPCQ